MLKHTLTYTQIHRESTACLTQKDYWNLLIKWKDWKAKKKKKYNAICGAKGDRTGLKSIAQINQKMPWALSCILHFQKKIIYEQTQVF